MALLEFNCNVKAVGRTHLIDARSRDSMNEAADVLDCMKFQIDLCVLIVALQKHD